MAKRRASSGGVRNPVRNAILCALATLAGALLVILGVMDMRETGRSGSPLLALGVLPALLCPIGLVHFLRSIGVFRDLRSGRAAIARWTVPPGQFDRFRAEQQRIPAASILANYYRPPRVTPGEGVPVIFSEQGVLVGDGYFPLSVTGGRRVRSVRHADAEVPLVEFELQLDTLVRTSSATIDSQRTVQALRIPVAADATDQAAEVVRRYRLLIARHDAGD